MLNSTDIERALRAVGELLEADDERASIVVIGGAALHLLNIVERTTRDVDIVATTREPGELDALERPPEPLPSTLQRAIAQVAADFGLPEQWLNCGPAGQWDVGLPPGFVQRVEWRRFAALDVGLCSRIDLIFFKLEAAADQPNANTRHFHDLVALTPTDDELTQAKAWVGSKNVGAEYRQILDRVIDLVTRHRQ